MTAKNLDNLSAAEVMTKHVELVGTDLKAWLQLFASDAVLEFPYGASLDVATRFEGKDAIEAHMRSFTGAVGPFRFSDLDVTESCDGTRAWASFRGEAWAKEREVMYRQDYAAFLELEDGKIKLYREYWNPCRVAYALGTKLRLDESAKGKRQTSTV